MKPVKIVSAIAVLMMLLNGFLVYQIVSSNQRQGPPHHSKGRFGKSVIKTLKFDQAQIEAYEKLIQEHQIVMMKLEEIRGEKLAIAFDALKGDDTSLSNADLKELEQIERERIMFTHKHFADVKALCNPDQLPAFEQVLQQAVQMLAGPPKRQMRGPKH